VIQNLCFGGGFFFRRQNRVFAQTVGSSRTYLEGMQGMTDGPEYQAVEWETVQRALVIMAHPDDPDFTCGGTATQMARQGIEVTYLILTNGDKGNHNPEITRNQLVALRKIEQRAAADVCGVKHVQFMGEEDGFLQPTREIRYRVTREIRRIRPEVIICTDPDRYFVGDGYINHPDHRNAGLVALEAIFPASDNPMFSPDAETGRPFRARLPGKCE
jgi:LmbE family N-acetylglucosaminyl deacetylase